MVKKILLGAAAAIALLLLFALTRPDTFRVERSVVIKAEPELDRLADLDGPAIFAANHHSHVDTPLLLSSLPEPWRHKVFIVAAADYFFTNRLAGGASALALNAIPIERTKVTRRSADLAADLIAQAEHAPGSSEFDCFEQVIYFFRHLLVGHLGHDVRSR